MELSNTPAGEDTTAPPASAVMDPLLLMAASMGDCEALKSLLNWGDAPVWPKAVPSQVVVEVPVDAETLDHNITTNGSVHQQASGGDRPVAPSAETSLLEGVTPLGDTALHVIAKSGHSSKESFLDSLYVVYNKAKHLLDKPNKLGDTPLHCASRAGSCKMVYCLLELAKGEEGGIDRVKSVLRKQNMRGETTLHDAIRGRNDDIVILLLMEDSQLARVPSEGMSPLCLAVLLERYMIASILHEKDNQLSYSAPDGQNVLHVSSFLRDIEMSEVLLGWNKELAKKQCHNGNTPLHLMCLSWWGVMVPVLLEANSSAASQPNGSGSFPIHIASSKNRLEAVINLLQRCPECVNLCDTTGRTFLHVAVKNKCHNIVSYACRAPLVASILNIQDNDGNTALHLAVQVGDLRIVCSLLRELQVHLNIPNYSGRTPLSLAWGMIPRGFYYAGNPQRMIYVSLFYSGANYGCYGAGLLVLHEWNNKFQLLDNDTESNKIKDSTQVLGIGSVLIATVAFGATFAVPGGYRADDHPNRGTPTLAGRYAFDAFIMATTLAFVCASVATTSLMFSGMAMVDLAVRLKNFNSSVYFAAISGASLAMSFALGIYMVLSPVSHNTAIVVLVVTLGGMLIGMIEPLQTLRTIAALRNRLGKRFWRPAIRMIFRLIFYTFWPLIIILGWPAWSTKYRNN